MKRFLVRAGVVSSGNEVPVHSTISRGALNDAYDTLKEITMEKLPRNSHFHLSCDTWTDRYRHYPYISIVMHFLDESFHLHCVALKTDYFESPHTGPAISEEIRSTLREFKLEEKYLFAAISDSASNMISGLRDFIHIRCADHRIHRGLTADFHKTEPGRRVLELRTHLMKIHRHLLFKKTLVSNIAKERAQEQYLDALVQAEQIENVSISHRSRHELNLCFEANYSFLLKTRHSAGCLRRRPL